MPQTMVQLAPRVAPCRTRVGRSSSMRRIALRGLNTLVNTIDGPQNTSSSRVTPSYTETLFWIFTLLPMLTFGPITTFWPIRQFLPRRELLNTWETCQIVVPSPISTSSSMKADSWTKYVGRGRVEAVPEDEVLCSKASWQRWSTVRTRIPSWPSVRGGQRDCMH